MSPVLSENLPIILIVAAIVVALLWWLLSRRSPDNVEDLPATSTPLDALEKTENGIGDVARSLAAEFTTVAPIPPPPQSGAKPSKPVVRKAKTAVKKVSPTPAPDVVAPAEPATSATVSSESPIITPKATKTKPVTTATATVPDDIGVLKGVGPKLITMLKSLGVTSLQQVANWSDADVAEIDGKLGAFAGRISRDNWVDQARLLSSGDIAGFEQKYGALGGGVK